MKVIASVLLLCLLSETFGMTREFAEFVTKYNKNYHPGEIQKRFRIFQENKARSAELTQKAAARGYNTQYGVTKFSDLTPEEFQSMYLGYKKSANVEVDIAQPANVDVDIPVKLDWRNTAGIVTPVKDQGQCGSCWAFSATEGTESAWALAGHSTEILSPQQVVSCDNNDYGCGGGDLPTAFAYIKTAGLETNAKYPYTSGNNGDNGVCKYSNADVVSHISGFKYATQNGNETQMQAEMVTHGPLSICVDASTWQNYQGGIVEKHCAQQLDHCVQLVGWDDSGSIPYWIIRNSWNTNWGIQGYIYVERGKDLCGVADEATYVTI